MHKNTNQTDYCDPPSGFKPMIIFKARKYIQRQKSSCSAKVRQKISMNSTLLKSIFSGPVAISLYESL